MALLCHAIERRSRPSRVHGLPPTDSQTRCSHSREKDRVGRGPESSRRKAQGATVVGSRGFSPLPADKHGHGHTSVVEHTRTRGHSEILTSSCTTKLSESHEASDHRRSEEAELRPVSAAERRERVVARRNTLLMQMEEQQKLQGVARAARERLDERLRLGANRSLPAVPAYLCKQLLHNIPHTTETITPSGQRTRRVSKHQGGRLRSQGGGGIRGKEEVQERRTEEEEIPEVASQCGGDAIALGECSICLEGFGEVHSSMRLPCQHRFHTHCVTLWLRKRNSCPYCRAPQLLSTSSPREGSGWYHSDD